MIARLGLVLLALTGVAIGFAYLSGYGYTIPIEAAVRAETMAHTSPGQINRFILDALERDDVEDADMYVEVARFLDYDVPPPTLTKLNDAHELSATVVRNTYQFGEGFVTGKGDSNAGLAGAVTSDLTVIGDLRDIATEGAKMLAGQEYSDLILGLSVVGVGVTAATIATGGGGIIAKAGISLVKAAKRAGRLTNEFATVLTRLTTDAVNMPLLRQTMRGVDLTDLTKTQRIFTDYGKNVRAAKLLPLLSRMGEVNNAVGPAETIRLMKFMKTGENLDDVAAMTKRFGVKSRGIMELTGKIALRSFKTSFRIVEWLAKSLIGVLMWIGGLLAMTFMSGIRLFSRRAAS
ncbi:MAG: hypothetical protein ABL973_06750 [Micropepsaceae bacterium]